MKTAIRISGPTNELVTIDEAKDHCYIIHDEDDQILYGLIIAARKAIENRIGKLIGEQTVELGLSYWPYDCYPVRIELPRPPARELLSIKYTLQDLTETTLVDLEASPQITSDIYVFDTLGLPGGIYLRSGESWPTDILAEGFPIRIRYKAGIVEGAHMENLRLLILLVVGYLYAHRDDNEGGGLTEFLNSLRVLGDGELYEEMR